MRRRGVLISAGVAVLLAVVAVALIAAEPGPTQGHRGRPEPPCINFGTGEPISCSEPLAKNAEGKPNPIVGESSGGGAVYDIAKVYLVVFLVVAFFALLFLAVRVGLKGMEARKNRKDAAFAARREATGGDQPASDPEAVQVEPNMGGIALSGLAAVLGIVSVFLPALETSAFSHIEGNTLIQSGNGWLILGFSIGVLGGTYRVYNSHKPTWWVAVLGGLILASAIYSGTGSRTKLHSVLGVAGRHLEVTGTPAVGIYAAGVAGVLAIIGGSILAGRTIPSYDTGPQRRTKTCPDCAETVLEAANVCKHCGHRFASSEPTGA